MNTTTTVGWIHCGDSATSYLFDKGSMPTQFHIKKILTDNELMGNHYPGAEIVTDKNSIINDQAIELVVVSSDGKDNPDLIGEMLRAGKNVQILHHN